MIENGDLIDAILGENLSTLSNEELSNSVVATATNARAL